MHLTTGQERALADLDRALAANMRTQRERRNETSWGSAFSERFPAVKSVAAQPDRNTPSGWDSAFAAVRR
jgi:hypothetical protein